MALTSLSNNMVENVHLLMVNETFQTPRKSTVTEREALSVIVAMQKYRRYLLGNYFTAAPSLKSALCPYVTQLED